MQEVTVVGRAVAKLGKDIELEREWKHLMSESMKESGCRGFTLHRATDNPLEIMSVERWANQRAVEQHMKTAHVQRLLSQASDLVNGQLEIKIFQTIE